MPEVYVHAIEGRSPEQKKALMADITEAVRSLRPRRQGPQPERNSLPAAISMIVGLGSARS